MISPIQSTRGAGIVDRYNTSHPALFMNNPTPQTNGAAPMQAAEIAPVTLMDYIEQARAGARCAELAIRKAASNAATGYDGATPAWIVLHELIEPATKIGDKLSLLKDLLKHDAKALEMVAKLVDAAKTMVAVCHFSPCDGSQVEARDALEAVLEARRGDAQ